MNENEYRDFLAESAKVEHPVVSAGQFGSDNKTLTHGYDVDRTTFHVYTHDGLLYARYYHRDGETPVSEVSGRELPAEVLRPNKRVYPQYTDRDFARIMRDLDFPLPFTTWSEPRREGPYYGATHLDDVEIRPVLS